MEPSFLQMVVTVDHIGRDVGGDALIKCELDGVHLQFTCPAAVATRLKFDEKLLVRIDPYKADE